MRHKRYSHLEDDSFRERVKTCVTTEPVTFWGVVERLLNSGYVCTLDDLRAARNGANYEIVLFRRIRGQLKILIDAKEIQKVKTEKRLPLYALLKTEVL